MAQLPPDGSILVQLIGNDVVIFERYTEEEYHRFPACGPDAISKAQKGIWDDERLTDEQRCFAHFWSGYFYAQCARGGSL